MSGYPGNHGEGTPLDDQALTRIECEYMRRNGRAGYFDKPVIGGMSGGPLLDVNYYAYGLNCRYDITQFGAEVGVCCMFNQLLLDRFNEYHVLGT